jgi:DNA-binding NarL/FixJ family response regulator
VSTTQPIRVLIAEDHPATRDGLCTILAQATDIDVVGTAQDGPAAKQQIADLRPDVLLLDLVMPGHAPFEIERWVRTHHPETVVLILTAHDRDAYLAQAVEASVQGYLTKEEAPHRLIDAIRRAAQGEVLITGGQLARVAAWRREVGARWESLTERERETAQQIAESKTNRQIAEALGISEHTVETHVGNILHKLACTTRTEVAVWLWKHGLVEEEAGSGGFPPEKIG